MNNENELRKQFSSVSAGPIWPPATYVHRMAVHNSFTLIRGEHECLSSDIIVRDKNDRNEIYTRLSSADLVYINPQTTEPIASPRATATLLPRV